MERILKYFQNLSDVQQQQFAELYDLYTDWNAKINVVSRKDIEDLYLRHVLHSLGIAKVLDFKNGTSLLDVGTGGGFPGIPLAILYPKCTFHLVDSINKKITVVKAISEAIASSLITSAIKLSNNAFSVLLCSSISCFSFDVRSLTFCSRILFLFRIAIVRI